MRYDINPLYPAGYIASAGHIAPHRGISQIPKGIYIAEATAKAVASLCYTSLTNFFISFASLSFIPL